MEGATGVGAGYYVGLGVEDVVDFALAKLGAKVGGVEPDTAAIIETAAK